MSNLFCDSQSHLLYVVSHFPGGAHNSLLLQYSSMGMNFEQVAAGDAWHSGTYPLIIQIFYNRGRLFFYYDLFLFYQIRCTHIHPTIDCTAGIECWMCLHMALQALLWAISGIYLCKLGTAGTSFQFTKRLAFINLRANVQIILRSRNTFMALTWGFLTAHERI